MKKGIKEYILEEIKIWFSRPCKDVLPYLRVLQKSVRLGKDRRLKALRLNRETVEVAIIADKDYTYNPHKDGCWTPANELPLKDLRKIHSKLRKR